MCEIEIKIENVKPSLQASFVFAVHILTTHIIYSLHVRDAIAHAGFAALCTFASRTCT
jgi:hypothetical protein